MVSIPAAGDPGSIPGLGVFFVFHCSLTQETRVQFPASEYFLVFHCEWIQRGWGECMDPASGPKGAGASGSKGVGASGSKGGGASGSKGVGARYEKQLHCNVNVKDPKKVFHQISFRCSI